jgi:hypothetical protein
MLAEPDMPADIDADWTVEGANPALDAAAWLWDNMSNR